MTNAADRRSIRRAEKVDKSDALMRANVVQELCSSTYGRGYVWEKLSAAHIFQTTFTGDALQSAFLEGERNQGLRLLDDVMSICPDRFLEMIRESNDRDNANEQHTRGPDRDGSAGEPIDDTGTDDD